MKLVQTTSIKRFHDISSIIRNASFSSGWLHIAVQCLFAVIIVTSFILIVLMATYHNAFQRTALEPENRCFANGCVMFCMQVPYFDDYEDDIGITVSKLPESCPGFYLALHNPMFHDGILRTDWIPRLRLPIIEFGITGGNLNHLTPSVFLHQQTANIRSLALHNLIIKTWDTDSLVGLSRLEELWINNCTVLSVTANVLMSVQQTLSSLTISHSKRWDPRNITGTSILLNLKSVDFSNNIFNDILDNNSFTGLIACTMLYLNSCNISAIGPGTFDHLKNIQSLFLNDNKLFTIPNDIFDEIIRITRPTPRISLHDNYWHCGCFANSLKTLVNNDALLTNPICITPEHYAGKTFFEVASDCGYGRFPELDFYSRKINANDTVQVIYLNSGCSSYDNGVIMPRHKEFKVISPVSSHTCPADQVKNEYNRNFLAPRKMFPMASKNEWIDFSVFFTTESKPILEIIPRHKHKHAIMWYQTNCPNEVYCINEVSSPFQIFDIDVNTNYIFCPGVDISNIDKKQCVTLTPAKITSRQQLRSKLKLYLFILTGVVCLAMGAICVYGLVRTHPRLLKGSKRILFVKHKTVDALVLPPKVNVKDSPVNEVHPDFNVENIYTVPTNFFGNRKLIRNISMRSDKSSAPSYISAVQPSELQLTEWRIKNNFGNGITSELTVNSWLYNSDSNHYIDIVDTDVTYESLK